MLGNLCVTIVGLGLKLVNKTVVPKLYNWLYLDDAVKYFDAHFPTGHDFIDYSLGTVNTYLVQPLISTFNNLFISPNAQFTLIERIILLAIGYSLICGVIYRLMNFLASGKKPISGTPRKVFKVLFEITATIKVFVIFSIELFVFPVYCGWLLDFCAASLFIPSFKENQSKIFVFLVTSYYTTLQIPYLRVLLYWSSGTLYMLFFALFIGMLRSTVIRPGVLFFIRSPDDPNARLIHDALRKPMSLQLSRIQFTGKFYSAFILVGIGGVTWGLRGFVQPSNNVDYNVFLPIQVPYYFTFILLTVIVPSIVESQPVITKYVRQYWARIFEISAHKVRLSHFVLGKPISHERGHVVYRSLWYQFFGNSLPDYTRPVSYRGAMDIFKENPSVTCCFVPDGNYVRVPDNDTVSRKYSRKLFVPVTKDDKLLVDIDESSLTSNTGYDTPTSEEDEINTDNAYTIVYRPPNFKWRCFGLICMLWVFAVILILLVALVAVLLGRPVLRANSIAFEYIPLVSINELTNMDWKLVDSASIAIGLAIELQILIYYDKHYSTEGPTGAGGNEVDRVANNDANLGEGVPGEVEPNQAGFWQRNIFGQIINRLPTPVLYTIPSSTLWIVWIVTVHNLCVDRPIRFVTNNLDVEFLLNFKTLFVHFIASFWTLLPALIYVTRRIPLEGHTVWQTMDRCGMIPVLINFCMIPLPAFIILFIMKTMNVSDNSMQVYLWPLLFVLLALVKSIKGGIEMYTNINDQVKQEKYVKGRAIENVDIDEEENDS
ncbi:ER/nuclear-envelope ubiquitin-protein ligase, putative, partial [Candida maltosa Xu316]